MESLQKYEDFSCAICLLLLCQPVKLQCSHLYCKYCIEKLKENDPNDFICPLCRAPVQSKLSIDKNLESEFLSKYKDLYQNRMKEIETLQLEDNFFERIKIFYGNSYEKIENGSNKNNCHQWTFFIKGEPKYKLKLKDIIKKVEVELDPSFGGVSLILRGDPLELSRKGYAEFTLVFKVFWQKWLKYEPTTLEHHLSFQKKITKKVHILKINKELIKLIPNKL